MIKMKGIVPGPYRERAFREELTRQMKAFINGPITDDFDATVETWTGKSKFVKSFGATGDGVYGKMETDDQKYRWVSEGTRDHMVPKSGTATMAFPSAYTAKTAPGKIGSGAGGPSGPIIVRTGQWKVSGIKPRKFPEAIKKKREPDFIRYGQEALKRGAKRSGHAI